MANYYRRFVKDYSALVRPLIDLTKQGVKFEWTHKCQQAFEKVKELLTQSPVMAHPQDNENLFSIPMHAM